MPAIAQPRFNDVTIASHATTPATVPPISLRMTLPLPLTRARLWPKHGGFARAPLGTGAPCGPFPSMYSTKGRIDGGRKWRRGQFGTALLVGILLVIVLVGGFFLYSGGHFFGGGATTHTVNLNVKTPGNGG